jgi:hypothetical protein
MPRKKRHKTFILVLEKDDPEKELEFELDFQMSLTARQRYEIMDRLVKDGMEFTKRDGHKISPAIVARP